MKIKKIIANKYIKLFFKIFISGICLYILSEKVSFKTINSLIQELDFFYLSIAFLFFIVSKLFSVLRLQRYLQLIGIHIKYIENLRLYWLGMFYNLFLPGGIGGDAYKAFYFRQKFDQVSLKSIITSLLKDRLNGFAVLCLIMVITVYFFSLPVPNVNYIVLSGIVFFGIILFLLERLIPPDSVNKSLITCFYSCIIQITQLISVLFILFSLNVHDNIVEIAFVFFVSTIVVMFPVSIGGIGLRELTFMYFADYLQYDKNASVSAAFIFFIINVLVSLPGIYYHFYHKKLKTN